MDFQEEINKIRIHYQESKLLFNKDEIDYLTLRHDKKRRLIGIFTKSYWKRKELFLNGNIFYSYIFKEYQLPHNDSLTDSAIWMLLSPHQMFDQNPNKYLEIVDMLNNLLKKKKVSLKERKLQHVLKDNLSEPAYYILPFELTEGHLVYLCSAYVKKPHTPSFHLGINLVISSPLISKEVALLPNKYWTESWTKYYNF